MTNNIKIYSLSLRKYAQIDKQLFYDFYGVSLLSDQYLDVNPYAKQYKDMIVQQVKEEYVPLLIEMVYGELKHAVPYLAGPKKWKKGFDFDFWKYLIGADIKKLKTLTLEQVAKVYNEGDWVTQYGGKPWGHITESLIQLINTTDTNQLITIIDHINDIQHNTGLMFHDFPKVRQWFSDALNVKVQATPEQLISYLSVDLQKFVTEDLQLRGQEIVVPEKYLTLSEKIRLAEDPNTPLKIFRELAKDTNRDVLLIIAKNFDAPPSVLEELAKNSDDEVRYWVASNMRTFPVTLEELAKDPNPDVRRQAKNYLNPKGDVWASNLSMRKKSYIMYNDKGYKFKVLV